MPAAFVVLLGLVGHSGDGVVLAPTVAPASSHYVLG
jgi:hypothetical protein